MAKHITIGVLGLGLFGSSVARNLAEHKIDVIAMDKNMDHVEEVLDDVAVAVQGDFTKIEQLLEAGFNECNEVIIASASKLEDSILAILNLQKMGIKKITVKTKNEEYQEVLLKVGASNVILPEVEMGHQTAMVMANPTFHELLRLDDRYNVIEFPYQEKWVGKSIVEVDFRNKYNTNIIAIRPGNSDEFLIEFGPNYVVKAEDAFLGVTTDDGLQLLIQ